MGRKNAELWFAEVIMQLIQESCFGGTNDLVGHIPIDVNFNPDFENESYSIVFLCINVSD